MAVFSINGEVYDDLGSALDAVRRIWSEHKAPAVAAQHEKARLKGQRQAPVTEESDGE